MEDQQQSQAMAREDEDNMWKAFMAFDHEQTGFIQTKDLEKAFEQVGEKVTRNDAFRMISVADPENSGTIQYAQFKQLVQEKREKEKGSTDEDLLDAFVSMGGCYDGSGFINATKLINTIKVEYGMTIDIEELIREVDTDNSGQIEFDEFKDLLQSAQGGEADAPWKFW